MTKSKIKEIASNQLEHDLDREMQEFFQEVSKMVDSHNAKNEMNTKQIKWVLAKCLEFLTKWENTNPDSKYWLKLIDAAEELTNKAKGNVLTKELLLLIMMAIEREKNSDKYNNTM